MSSAALLFEDRSIPSPREIAGGRNEGTLVRSIRGSVSWDGDNRSVPVLKFRVCWDLLSIFWVEVKH